MVIAKADLFRVAFRVADSGKGYEVGLGLGKAREKGTPRTMQRIAC